MCVLQMPHMQTLSRSGCSKVLVTEYSIYLLVIPSWLFLGCHCTLNMRSICLQTSRTENTSMALKPSSAQQLQRLHCVASRVITNVLQELTNLFGVAVNTVRIRSARSATWQTTQPHSPQDYFDLTLTPSIVHLSLIWRLVLANIYRV